MSRVYETPSTPGRELIARKREAGGRGGLGWGGEGGGEDWGGGGREMNGPCHMWPGA
jgi:hypothetical protein